jgi:hypothetical protein
VGEVTEAYDYLWEELHKLEPSSKLGGVYANKSGYHNTRKANNPNNYSVVDKEDKGGPDDKAAAIDWTFPDAQSGHYGTIAKYSQRLLASGEDPADHRLDGWREFYGNLDNGGPVDGYDFRYNEDATSDSSHYWHIHLSEDRDKVESRENKDKLLSVLRGEPVASELWPVKGDKGRPVENRQRQLVALGYNTGPESSQYDGIYGDTMVKAVDKFRKDNSNGKNTGGNEVTVWTGLRLDALYAALDSKPGPAGPEGPIGPAGPEGPPGPALGDTFTVQVVA